MFEEANRVARLDFSVTFQAWMLLFLLQLFAEKWSELLKDFQHRLPQNMQEHLDLQQGIVREKVLENCISDLRSHVRNVVGASGGRICYFSSDDLGSGRLRAAGFHGCRYRRRGGCAGLRWALFG